MLWVINRYTSLNCQRRELTTNFRPANVSQVSKWIDFSGKLSRRNLLRVSPTVSQGLVTIFHQIYYLFYFFRLYIVFLHNNLVVLIRSLKATWNETFFLDKHFFCTSFLQTKFHKIVYKKHVHKLTLKCLNFATRKLLMTNDVTIFKFLSLSK